MNLEYALAETHIANRGSFRARAWAASGFLCAAFAAFLSWLHATQEVVVFIHDSRIPAALFAIIAAGFALQALRTIMHGTPPSRSMRFVLACGVLAAGVVVPGRVMLVWRNRTAFGGAAQRDAHNALRLLVSAQEDHRIRTGSYSDVPSALNAGLLRQAPQHVRLSIVAANSLAWRGEAHGGAFRCVVHISAISGFVSHQHRNFLDDDIICAAGEAAPHARAPARIAQPGATIPDAANRAFVGEWVQERGDAARTGISHASAVSANWTTVVAGSIRAVASIVDGLVLVGTHGTGWLGALDLKTGNVRWRTRASNWIHQNPVAHSGIVVVGVGDKNRLMAGDPVGLGIGGVAAYDLTDGRLLWFGRSAGAVMTAPVIWSETVISADGAGHLESRALKSGTLIWRRRMPGYAVMASPALRDSTVFVALAHRFLCAYSARSGFVRWCYQAPRDFRVGGDPTPSVVGGAVYWSVAHDSTGLELLLGRSSARRYVVEKLTGRRSDRSSQWLIAVDAETGRERWKRELGGGYDPQGNMAGTAVPFRNLVLVISPKARKLFAIDTAMGQIRWSRASDALTRGAVTIVGTLAIATDASRHLHIVRATDGKETCRATLPDAPDRSGPTVVGGTAVFTGLSGLVFARPLNDVLRCASENPRRRG